MQRLECSCIRVALFMQQVSVAPWIKTVNKIYTNET